MSITALEPVRGFKCPISFDTTENPVYLKGCEHFFDRAVIENWFRSKFANADAAPCPMCNRQYGIAKFLPEGREQAIARLFERILIVPIVTHEINRKLAKWENYNHQIVVREQQLEKQSQIIEAQKQRIDEQTQQIESQNQKIASLNTTNETLYKKLKLVNSDISDKTKYNEKLKRDNEISKYAMGVVGAVCVPAVCVYPPVGAGMLVITVIGYVAAKSANNSSSESSESTDLTTKKEQ